MTFLEKNNLSLFLKLIEVRTSAQAFFEAGTSMLLILGTKTWKTELGTVETRGKFRGQPNDKRSG